MLPARKSVPRSSRQYWTTRSPDDRKETQTALVWSCFPFIRSDQNHLAKHSERGKKTRRTKEEVERQHQGMDRPRVRQIPKGGGEQGKIEKIGSKMICGAPTTLALKGLMMMMMSSRLFTMVRSSCGPIACWILARTSSLVTWSLHEMCTILR